MQPSANRTLRDQASDTAGRAHLGNGHVATLANYARGRNRERQPLRVGAVLRRAGDRGGFRKIETGNSNLGGY